METQLYLVPTPIGNMGDITLRALEVLKQVDLVLAEDTRQSRKLLDHYEIATPMRAFHMHNEHHVLADIVAQLQRGVKMAMVTDAGTPGISDPGYLLSRACIDAEIDFEVLPGATAFVPAIVLSGLPAHNFVFEGFLPVKKGRKTAFERLATETRTLILYESPHKLLKTLRDIKAYWGERRVSVSRELSKKFEETLRLPVSEMIAHFEAQPPKGEFVLVVEGFIEG
ncbi:16S rRNA (cytidine(1402)-2'-O)-methyltransferase [bacterium]|nr:16S rRNA (cytidine(1402)-2'-O)-methyltransferase [bacterium]